MWVSFLNFERSPGVPRLNFEGMCIPLRGNAVCILFISSERMGIFKLNFATLIQVLIETF